MTFRCQVQYALTAKFATPALLGANSSTHLESRATAETIPTITEVLPSRGVFRTQRAALDIRVAKLRKMGNVETKHNSYLFPADLE